jgi:hypothetical protein
VISGEAGFVDLLDRCSLMSAGCNVPHCRIAEPPKSRGRNFGVQTVTRNPHCGLDLVHFRRARIGLG